MSNKLVRKVEKFNKKTADNAINKVKVSNNKDCPDNSIVRVRFAPSTTGPAHIGSVKTIQCNFFFARRHGGKFILRIEDTDENRFVPGSEDYIEEVLEWLGIIPDEGPKQGGDYGPYRQSERKHIYKKYAEKLIKGGYAYYAFDTPEELDMMRKKQQAMGRHTANYNAITRMSMQNSLTLSEQEVEEKISQGIPYVIRLKVDHQRTIKFHDEVRGWIQVEGKTLDDKVLLKQTGMATYHLANVVDDHLMKISHVIRGEEWIPSTPIHCLIYEGLGWQHPVFAHLPLLLRHDGKGKLSKRSVDTSGIPIFPLEWYDAVQDKTYPGLREHGYLPDAVLNFLALLGRHTDNGNELMSINELCNNFSLKHINKSGIQVDMAKAIWFNQCYLRSFPSEELAEKYLLPALKEAGIHTDITYAVKCCDIIKSRVKFTGDLWAKHKYFFVAPTTYSCESFSKKWLQETARLFKDICDKLSCITRFDAEAIKKIIGDMAKNHAIRIGIIISLIRVAITGVSMGPELMEILVLLGREEVVARLKTAIKKWPSV